MSEYDFSNSQVILEAIVLLETEKQINNYLRDIHFQPNVDFLHCVREKIHVVKDARTIENLNRLNQQLTKHLCQYSLYELIRLGGEDASQYFNTHYYFILNNYSYYKLEEYILEFKDDEGWNAQLLSHKEWLCDTFSRNFYTFDSWDSIWQTRRRLLLEGLSWLIDPLSELTFRKMRSECDKEGQRKLDILHEILEDCQKNGVEKEVAYYDRDWFMTHIDSTEGTVKLSYLKGAVKSLKVHMPLSAAAYYYSIGNLLTDLAAEEGNYDEILEEALDAYGQACVLLPKPEQLDLISYIRRLQAELLQKQSNIDVRSEERVIAYYELALEDISEELFPDSWVKAHAQQAMFYCQRKHGILDENRKAGLKSVSIALLSSCAYGIKDEIFRCTVLLDVLVTSVGLVVQEILNDAVLILTRAVASLENSQAKTRLNILKADFLAKSVQVEKENFFEQAIEIYAAELENPEYLEGHTLAKVHIKLADRKLFRKKGDPIENTESAIFHYESAFSYLNTFEHKEQLKIILALAKSYMNRERGNKSDNFKIARRYYDQANNLLKQQIIAEVDDILPEFNDTFWASLDNAFGATVGELPDLISDMKAALSEEIPPEASGAFDRASAFANFYKYNGIDAEKMSDAILKLEHLLALELNDDGTQQGAAEMYYLLGRCYADIKEDIIVNGARAILYFQRGADIWESLLKHERLVQNLISQIEVHLRLEEWHKAFLVGCRAHILSETMRNQAENMDTRKFYAEKHAGIYQGLITSMLKIGQVNEAFVFAMNFKNKTYTEALASFGSRKIVLETDLQLKERMVSLNAERYRLVATKLVLRDIRSLEDGGGLRWAETQDGPDHAIQAIEGKIAQMTDDILFDYPGLTGWNSLSDITLDEIHSLSEKLGQAPLIEYVTHFNKIGAFVFFSGRLNYIELVDISGEKLINYSGLLQGFHDNTFWDQGDAQSRLEDLYEVFFAPILPFLPVSGKLYIAPTTILHWLPFQALRITAGDYLIERYNISYIDSLASLKILAERVLEAKRKTELRCDRLLSISFPGDDLAYLGNVDEEAESIQEFFNVVTAPDKYSCDPDTIIAEINSNEYDVIHFSGHSNFNVTYPSQSGLHLTQQQILTVDDIRLRASLTGQPLVVLSSCLSGQSALHRGDAITGLATAFINAGASCVLCSMWAVSDQTTKELFNSFYKFRNLEHQDDCTALRSAMLGLREKRAYKNRPQLWAGFKLFGVPIL